MATRRAGFIYLTHNGVTKTAAEWARELGMSNSAICRRIAKGWPVELIVTRPSMRGVRADGLHGSTTHGRASDGQIKTRSYRSWRSMKQRCNTPSSTQWEWYGARGIKVCTRWNDSFDNFLADMGEAPSPSHTIDRIDPNGNYEPGNCRWVTMAEQAENKRPRSSTVWLTFRGKTQSVTEWARELGMPRFVVYARISHGWSAESALTEPLRKVSKPAKKPAKRA